MSQMIQVLKTALQHKRAGNPQLGIPLVEQVLQRQPANAEVNHLLGSLLLDSGESERGTYFLGRAVELDPKNPMFHKSLGDLHRGAGRFAEAAESYRHVARLDSSRVEAHLLLGNTLMNAGQFDEADRAYRDAVAEHASSPRLSMEHGRMLLLIGRATEAAALLRAALEADPDDPSIQSQLAMCTNYCPSISAEQSLAEHKRFGQLLSAGVGPRTAEFQNDRDPDRRLRIGFISPDFYEHSVSYFFEPVVESLDRDRFEVCCYARYVGGRVKDATSARLEEGADLWREITGQDDATIADLIRSDRIDILVDLAGLTMGNNLGALARGSAPVQATWCGYPCTTGLDAVGYRIVDALTDPPGAADALAVESLTRLEGCFLCYRPPEGMPEPAPPPAESAGHVTFGSFNMLTKLSDPTLELWAQILERVPDSRLLLKNHMFTFEQLRLRCLDRFEALGVDRDRVQILGKAPTVFEHMDTYARVDVALDTLPYNGTTTTCEAMWMGVPVVSLVGDRHAGRVGLSLLSAVGLPDLAAASPEDYVRAAVDLASNADRRGDLRVGFRDRLLDSPLCDGPGFAKRLGDVFDSMWRSWCESGS